MKNPSGPARAAFSTISVTLSAPDRGMEVAKGLFQLFICKYVKQAWYACLGLVVPAYIMVESKIYHERNMRA